jgi:hypothetical protein
MEPQESAKMFPETLLKAIDEWQQDGDCAPQKYDPTLPPFPGDNRDVNRQELVSRRLDNQSAAYVYEPRSERWPGMALECRVPKTNEVGPDCNR